MENNFGDSQKQQYINLTQKDIQNYIENVEEQKHSQGSKIRLLNQDVINEIIFDSNLQPSYNNENQTSESNEQLEQVNNKIMKEPNQNKINYFMQDNQYFFDIVEEQKQQQGSKINNIQQDIINEIIFDSNPLPSNNNENQTNEQSEQLEQVNNQIMKETHNYFNKISSSMQSLQMLQEKTLDNKNSIVKYLYKPNSNQITIIKKQNINDNLNLNNHLYQNEKNILLKLKGHNITLDIIKQNQNDLSIEQHLGKIDLHNLKKYIKDKHIFEVYFIVLLQKLNKMHKLGVAHSDIKPKNLVISFNDEPYFIDFDCSIQIKDYQNYLNGNTYLFNLDIFFEKKIINNKIEFQAIKFQSEQDVKLCDRSQLALTFLYLLCENKDQNELFEQKKFNLLMTQIKKNTQSNNDNFDSSLKNRSLILFIISSILNQADPDIKIVGEYQQRLTINHISIYNQLKSTSNIDFNKRKNIFVVKRIDKYSIQLLDLLIKIGCDIRINPQKMKIIPQPDLKEYDFICKKYKQIQEYYEGLLNGQPVNKFRDITNLCKYLKTLQEKKCTFNIEQIKYLEQFSKSIKKSKYVNTLELNFIFQPKFLESFLKTIREQLTDFSVVKFWFEKEDKDKLKINLNKRRIRCTISRTSFTPEIKNAYFYFQSMEDIENKFSELINCMKKYYQIYQIKITIENRLLNIFSKYDPKYFYRLQNLINNNSDISLQFQIFQEKLYQQQKIQQFFNALNNINKIEKQNLQKENSVYEQSQNIELDYKFKIEAEEVQAENIKNKQDDCILKVRKKEYEQGGDNVIQVLDNISRIDESYKLILKFFDFSFLDKEVWERIIQIIEVKENIQLQIELVNCAISQDILDLLKEKQQSSSEVEYKFYDEFNQQEDDYNKLLYTFDISNEKNLNQVKLKVLFYRKLDSFNKENNTILQEKKSFYSLLNQQQINQKINQNEINQDINNIKNAQSNFIKNSQNYNINLKELNVLDTKLNLQDREQINTLKIKQNKLELTQTIQNKKDLKYIIDKVKNNSVYMGLRIDINGNKLQLNKYGVVSLVYLWDTDQLDILDQFFVLLYFIFKNFKKYRLLHFAIVKSCEQFNIELTFPYYLRSQKDNKKYTLNFNSPNYHPDNTQNQNINPDYAASKNIVSDDDILNSKIFIENYRKIQIDFKIIISKEMLLNLASDNICKETLDNILDLLYNSFESQYIQIKQKMNKVLEIKDYLLSFVFENKKMNDQQFLTIQTFAKQILIKIEKICIGIMWSNQINYT